MIVKESNDTTRNFGIGANIQRKIDETNVSERERRTATVQKWINWKKRNVG
jgi:hypothetical protein